MWNAAHRERKCAENVIMTARKGNQAGETEGEKRERKAMRGERGGVREKDGEEGRDSQRWKETEKERKSNERKTKGSWRY